VDAYAAPQNHGESARVKANALPIRRMKNGSACIV
jgi:hypothetical protein